MGFTRKVSIFNEVIGPVMHGPSSSHTAASYHIGSLVRNLLDDEPEVVDITFAKDGSYAAVYHQQGSDRGFATGLLGWKITDERFLKALDESERTLPKINFRVSALKDNHPNAIELHGMSRSGRNLTILARSIGGGAVELRKLNDWDINLRGDAYDVLIELGSTARCAAEESLSEAKNSLEPPSTQSSGDRTLIHYKLSHPLNEAILINLRSLPGLTNVWTTSPVFFPQPGEPLFTSGKEMIDISVENNCSLGRVALSYEAKLLGITEDEASNEMYRRYEIMRESVIKGLDKDLTGMQLLQPSAGSIMEAERTGRTAVGGIHTRAAARALSVMHVDCSMGVVCAAPTGGVSRHHPWRDNNAC